MIYLDNAATSWPKPPVVYEAIYKTIDKYGANPGRSGHYMSMAAGRIVWQARERLCEFFNANDPAAFIMTQNCTGALNLAIKGVLEPNDHVVSTVLEHNSVLRPLHTLEAQGMITLTLQAPEPGEYAVTARQIEAAIRPNTRLVVMTHASNVTGAVQPIEEVARVCERRGVLLLVDAAQSAGVVPIDLMQTPIDMLAFPGHKGLYGPQGTGCLYIKPGLRLRPLMEGGTGSDSQLVLQPDDVPERYESGTLNTPGIAGLSAGLRYVAQRQQEMREVETQLTQAIWEGLCNIPDIQIYGPPLDRPRVGVICFNVADEDSGMIADELDQEYIAVRAGLHCAPLVHRHQGTFEQGAVRVSVGMGNTHYDVKEFLRVIEKIAVGG